MVENDKSIKCTKFRKIDQNVDYVCMWCGRKRIKYSHVDLYTPIPASDPPHTTTPPLHDYDVKRGPCFSLSNRGYTSVVFSNKMSDFFKCKIAFLHANMTHHWAMGDMISQREERTYLYNALLRYFKIIADIRWPRTVLDGVRPRCKC